MAKQKKQVVSTLADAARAAPKYVVPHTSWFDKLPPEVQQELKDLAALVRSGDLDWPVAETYRFAKKQLAERGIDLPSMTSFVGWWRGQAE